MMIDFHAHILPGIDDGSKNVSESLALLGALTEQGVDTVVATPHFLVDHESVDAFLARRHQAALSLAKELPSQAPRILLGAEVKYYYGISNLEGLSSLCVEGSRFLLLEMPVARWTECVIKELLQLSCTADVVIVLAHVERALGLQNKKTIQRLLENDVLFQVNASFFLDFFGKRRALAMLDAGEIHFLGSDCHNMTSRPPRIGQAMAVIRKKRGDDFALAFADYGRQLLCE